MIANCTCGTSVEVRLDLNTNDVICQNEIDGKICGRVVDISSFMKTAMRASGDVVRDTKPKIPFGGMLSVCQKCGKEFSAEIDKKTHKCHCPKCKTEFKLSTLFKERLIQYKIYVGQSASLVEKDGSKDEEDLGGVSPVARGVIKTAAVEVEDDDEDGDIKKMFGESKIEKPVAVNKLKERALAEKGLLKKPTFKRITTDSNGDPIGAKAVFHPKSEESDAELVADLEGRAPIKAKKTPQKAVKKVKNK